MKTIEMTKNYLGSAEDVFDCLDDLSVTGMHMTKSSMPMMGGKMNLEFLSPNRKGLHTRYRWTGKVLWMNLDFTVNVFRWVKGKEKSWATEGPAKMILFFWFKMGLKVEGDHQQSTAHFFITYEKPKEIFNRVLSFLLADWYCKWCLKSMLNEAGKRLANENFREMKIV